MGLIKTIKSFFGLDSKKKESVLEAPDLSHLINEDEVIAMPVELGFEDVKNLPLYEDCPDCLFGQVEEDITISQRQYRLNPNFPEESLHVLKDVLEDASVPEIIDIHACPSTPNAYLGTPVVDPVTGVITLKDINHDGDALAVYAVGRGPNPHPKVVLEQVTEAEEVVKPKKKRNRKKKTALPESINEEVVKYGSASMKEPDTKK
jgi:hypothetical protein